MELFLQKVQTQIEYNFINQNLLYQAFIDESYYKINKLSLDNEGLYNNKPFQLMGIKVANALFTCEGIKENSIMKRGIVSLKSNEEITDYISGLLRDENIDNIINNLGFHQFLLFDENLGKEFVNKVETRVELFYSLIGALAFDSKMNFDTISRVAFKMMKYSRNLEDTIDVYTNKLIAYAKMNKTLPPQYKFFNIQDNMVRCLVSYDVVLSSGLLKYHFSEGKGYTKEEAQKEASLSAWTIIEKSNHKSYFPDFNLDNSINVLQILFQKKRIDNVDYVFSDHGHEWICKCIVNDFEIEKNGTSKKEAKKNAAFGMLEILKTKNI